MTEEEQLNQLWREVDTRLSAMDERTIHNELKSLLSAVEEREVPGPNHDEVQALLSTYVQAEIAGLEVESVYPAVAPHLDECDKCMNLYVELRELARLDAEGTFAYSGTLPKIDSSFLARKEVLTLPRYVQRLATRLAQMNNSPLVGLERMIDAFFDVVEDLGGSFSFSVLGSAEPLAILSGDDGDAEDTAAIELLGATYLATQAVASSVAPDELSMLSSKDLSSIIEQKTLEVLQKQPFHPVYVRNFARLYAAAVSSNLEELREHILQENR